MAAPGPGGEPAGGGTVPHRSCAFTGRALCTCIYGSSIVAQRQQGLPPDGGAVAADAAAAAQQHMLQARVAWRLLHGPDSSQEPVAIMLPRLERQAPPPGSAEAAAAAAAAAAARLERAEAAAQAAALRAASLAGASGLPYRPPEGLSIDLSGVHVANLSELERQVEAVRRAQEARQAAAAAAAAAAQVAGGGGLPQLAGAGEAPPMVLPLAALVHGTQEALPAATPDGPEDMAAAAGGGPHERPASGSTTGRPLRRTRSHDVAGGTPPGALTQGNLSMPLPVLSTSSGGRGGLPASGSRPRRSPAGKPPAKPASARAGRGAGPGKGPRGKGSKQLVTAHEGHAPPGSAERPSGQPPDLSQFGEGYQPRGPSSTTPPKSWLLKAKDLKAGLQGKLVQTFWPDGGQWWPAVVLHVSLADKALTLLYETGDEEAVQYPVVVQAGELAWLLGPSGAATPRSAAHSPSPNRASQQQQQQQQGGTPPSSMRRQPSAGRPKSPQHGSTASAPDAAPAPALAQQQQQHARAASGELGLSSSLGEPGGPVQREWPPLGEGMDLDERGSSPQLLGDSGPVATSSEGTGALLPPLAVGGTHGFGSSMRLGGHRGSELLLVDNPAFGGLGMLPSLHLDSPAELPQQLAAAAAEQEQRQQQQEQQQEEPAQQQHGPAVAAEQLQQQAAEQAGDDPQEQPPEQQADGHLLGEGSQQLAQQGEQQEPEAQQQQDAKRLQPPPQQPGGHSTASPEPSAELQAEPSQQRQPGSPLSSEQVQEGEHAAAKQHADEERPEAAAAAQQQPAPEQGVAQDPPLQQALQRKQQADSMHSAHAAPAEASRGPAEPARCCSGGQCSPAPADTFGLPGAEAGCRRERAAAVDAAEEAAVGDAGGNAPDPAAAGEPGDTPAAADAGAAGAPATAAEEPAEAPQAELEAPWAPAAAAPLAAAAAGAKEQPAHLPAAEPAQQADAVQVAGAEGAEQATSAQQQASQLDGQPHPSPVPEEQPPPPPPEEAEGAAEQPDPAAEQPEPAKEQPEPAAEPALADGPSATELPPVLAAAAAQPPAGYHLASTGELLELGEGAVGRQLAVATLSSAGWQSAHVRQCSAAHGLLQVQFALEGMLLVAQEEGATFLLSVPANGSPPS